MLTKVTEPQLQAQPQKIPHQNFTDWMKATGMLLVIIGHVFGDPLAIFNQVAQPVYAKQLGVCFFVFVTGWSLANDSSPRFKVVFNRIFLMYLYGIIAALIVSITFFFYKGDTNPSNYLPFFAGANVILNAFPANPTTWYIGLYFHLLLFWCFFLQGRNIKLVHLLIAFVAENIIRCVLISSGKDFTAYMILPNWITIFLLGSYLRHKRDLSFHPKILLIVAGWIGVMALWPGLMAPFGFGGEFPFRSSVIKDAWSLPLQSVLISFIYITGTLLFFTIVRHLPSSSVVSFFSRNTLITFIAHMPIVFELSRYFYSMFDSEFIQRVVWILVLYIGLGIISEIIQKTTNTRKLRTEIWMIIVKFFPKLDPSLEVQTRSSPIHSRPSSHSQPSSGHAQSYHSQS